MYFYVINPTLCYRLKSCPFSHVFLKRSAFFSESLHYFCPPVAENHVERPRPAQWLGPSLHGFFCCWKDATIVCQDVHLETPVPLLQGHSVHRYPNLSGSVFGIQFRIQIPTTCLLEDIFLNWISVPCIKLGYWSFQSTNFFLNRPLQYRYTVNYC